MHDEKPNCKIYEFVRPSRLVGRQIVLGLSLLDDGEHIHNAINICNHKLIDDTKPISMFYEDVLAEQNET